MFHSTYSCKHSACSERDKESYSKGVIVLKSRGFLRKVSVVLTKQDNNIDAESILQIIIHKESSRFLKLFH